VPWGFSSCFFYSTAFTVAPWCLSLFCRSLESTRTFYIFGGFHFTTVKDRLMNEWIMMAAFVLVLLLPQFLRSKVKQPALTYIQLSGAVLLIILVWGFGDPDRWTGRLALTAIALGSALQAVREYRKAVNHSQPK
jgi:hypothetical protein